MFDQLPNPNVPLLISAPATVKINISAHSS
jgi:hypothetical protein